ncbi:hypothetical protein EDB85DRAFT_2141246 [Lactarius pseudohatsudake]|nr:hypothetical protein EDB85DRAFT_2141246 [Lactarius pseudohatsudake]
MVDELRSHTLPIELGYKILEEAWSLPLSRTERHGLLVALPSVCRAFRAIAGRLFLRDAHVVSPAYAAHLLSLLQLAAHDHDSGLLSPCTCNSITFYIYDPSPLSSSSGVFHLYGSSNPTNARDGDYSARYQYQPRRSCASPSPRRAALHGVVLHARARTRTPGKPPFARASYLRRCALPMPSVRTLGIYGACPAFVVDVASACPALQRLETDDVRGVLVLQPSLLPFMLLTAEDAAQVKQSEHLGRKSAPDEKASVVDAFARTPEDMRRKPGLPYGFLLKRKPARI